jgi:2-keto-4-pentenoate hydratase/2-oxohepta-3-ene-1,7-dioic acid hydratase in catechol pathway
MQHAAEANMALPKVPVLFIKPATAVADPYPGKIVIPKVAQDGSSDYEGELTVVIGKTGKDIKEEEAYDYVLGYTSGNDVSARNAQFASSQWCYSKGSSPLHLSELISGLDYSAPIGPVLVSPKALKDPHNLEMRSIHNGNVVQSTNTRYSVYLTLIDIREMIFSIPKTIAFLSAGTTLEAGSLIMVNHCANYCSQ